MKLDFHFQNVTIHIVRKKKTSFISIMCKNKQFEIYVTLFDVTMHHTMTNAQTKLQIFDVCENALPQ